ncbi:MAG: hypothetical protein M9892_04470 [Bacteroidetes bacterium]|nr:hypothetical protein [Bacteroidota bacterium]
MILTKREREFSDVLFDTVFQTLGVSRAQLIGLNRGGHYPDYRAICYYLLRKYTKITLKRAGTLFGGRDHSTIINGLKQANDFIATHDKFFTQNLHLVETELLKILRARKWLFTEDQNNDINELIAESSNRLLDSETIQSNIYNLLKDKHNLLLNLKEILIYKTKADELHDHLMLQISRIDKKITMILHQ